MKTCCLLCKVEFKPHKDTIIITNEDNEKKYAHKQCWDKYWKKYNVIHRY